MLSYFKNLVKKKEGNILLTVFIILIITNSFGIGYLIASNKKESKIIIKKNNSLNINKSSEKSNNKTKNKAEIKEKSFIASKKSNKYHHPNCQWAKRISKENQIWFSSKKEAEKSGYHPCSYVKKHEEK